MRSDPVNGVRPLPGVIRAEIGVYRQGTIRVSHRFSFPSADAADIYFFFSMTINWMIPTIRMGKEKFPLPISS